MGIFNRLMGWQSSGEPNIRESDRMWLEKHFMKLVKAYGYPDPGQFSISPAFFPYTFKQKEIRVEHVITDCINLLELDGVEVDFELFTRAEDSENLQIGNGKQSRCSFIDFDRDSGHFNLELTEAVLAHPVRTIVTVCLEMCRAKILQGGDWVEEWEDSGLLTFLAAIHFGFGLIIGPNLTENGELSRDFFLTDWSIHVGFPQAFMAYAFVIYAWISQDLEPQWKHAFPPALRKEFERGIAFMKNRDDDFFDEEGMEHAAEQEMNFREAESLYKLGRYEEAIQLMDALASDPAYRGDRSLVLNNLGYYKMRLSQFEDAIPEFEQALELDPQFGYAYDNLGLCYIMVGELEQGKHHLDKASRTRYNDPAYSLRNFGIYYQKLGKMETAKQFFHEAYAKGTEVDLLDFYYGEFLINYGELEKGKRHIQLSAQAGEREGIALLRKMEGR